MKSVAVVVCVLLLQVMWLSFSRGQDTDCTALKDQSACCASNGTCVFVTCLKSNNTVSGCYNSTAEAGCDVPANATDVCKEANSTTTPAPTQTNATTAAPSGGNATTPANASGNATTPANANNGTTNATTGGPSTAGTANGTTGATTGGTPVDCTSFNTSQINCCAAGNATACIFFNCSSSGNVSGTFCVAAGSTPKCALKNETASSNICAASPSGGQHPTQAPSGGDSGGQQFDASSFIGGIVLCAGLIAIAYFGVKFYRSKQERNYESM